MDIREIWPEPPYAEEKRGDLCVPEHVEAFGRKLDFSETKKQDKSLSQVLNEIIICFNQCILSSTAPQRIRSIDLQIQRVDVLYKESNLIISGYRREEASEMIKEALKLQILKKKNLIHNLSLAQK
ncbi:hypothetical protein NEFER03_2069 [Nematocida sp. LUAm3]|nr:hypothetical protein NEFER03_2069 [Nematocida sp. LUAm3]KAI5176213.1 hypothetical protein NEFER02_2019 [Nematocida sp. LUAm2]KAI5179201.1 hypothetical protein NEFER01_2058 [Nematocida sp. LUAm1]